MNPSLPTDYDPSSFYRTAQPQPDWNVWRQGNVLVVSKGVAFPMCCVKCGAAAQRTVRTKLQWHSPWLYLLAIFPGLLIYAIVATVVSQRAEFDLPVCEAHRVRRLQTLGFAWFVLAASIGLPLLALATASGSENTAGLSCIAGTMGMLVALVVFSVGGRLLQPTFLDGYVVKLKGAGDGFLSRCPPMG